MPDAGFFGIGLSEWLPKLGFGFALVLARVSAALSLLPAFGESGPPPVVRAGLAFALSLLLLPVVATGLPAVPPQPLALGAMVMNEVLRGVMLGWLARAAVLSLGMAGSILSTMTGLSSVLQPDPVLGQVPALGRLMGLVAPVLIFATGLHATLLQALVGSYALWPVGVLGVGFEDGMEAALRAVAEATGLALRLSAPFVIAGITWQAGLALAARLVPSLQVFSVAAPGQIIGGLLMVGLLAAGLLSEWSGAIAGAFATLPGL